MRCGGGGMGGRPHELKFYAAELRRRRSKGPADESDQPCNLRLSTWLEALGDQRDQLPP